MPYTPLLSHNWTKPDQPDHPCGRFYLDSELKPWGSRHAVGGNRASVHTALHWVSHVEIQRLHEDGLHNLMFDRPRDGNMIGTCWIQDQDIGAGKKKDMAKGDTGYTEFNPEKGEGRQTEAASQSDENIKGKPGDRRRGTCTQKSGVERKVNFGK